MQTLIVTHAFGPYAKGARITDAQKVQEHRDSPNVVPVNEPDPPAPDAREAEAAPA